MATYGYTFTSGDTLTPTKLNDARTVSEIVNADIKSDAAIAGTKIAPAFGSQDITVSGANRSITNTGNFALSFGTNNTERMRIDPSGNVGIGTTSPSGRLHVAGGILTGPTVGEGGEIGFSNVAGTTTSAFIDVGPSDAMRIYNVANTPMLFYTNNQGRMCINANGNVGIGTTLPSARFSVSAGDDKKQFVVDVSSDPVVKIGTPDWYNVGELAFVTGSGGERMRIDANGNVAIGTTIPSARFSICTGDDKKQFVVDVSSDPVVKIGTPDWYNVGELAFVTGSGGERMRIKSNGQVRFVPLAADPAGAETGDVYYNSGTNKLKVYNGSSWVDLH